MLLFLPVCSSVGVELNIPTTENKASVSASISGAIGGAIYNAVNSKRRPADEREISLMSECKSCGSTYDVPALNETPAMRKARRSRIEM